MSAGRVGAGRIHHPKRAARLGTPVRSRFCNHPENTEKAAENKYCHENERVLI